MATVKPNHQNRNNRNIKTMTEAENAAKLAADKLKVEQEAKNSTKTWADLFNEAQTAIGENDISVMSNGELYDLIKPCFKQGVIIGIVVECQDGNTELNGKTSDYRVKISVITDSDKEDGFGRKRKVRLSYWLTSYEPETVNQLVAIKAADKAVTLNASKNHEGYVKRLDAAKDLISADKQLKVGYEYLVNPSGYVMTNLQGNKLFTIMKAPVLTEEA